MKVSRAQMRAHIRRVFWRSPWAAECASSVTAMAWAAVIGAAPNDLEIWPGMALMLRLCSQEFLTATSLVLGAGQFLMLALDVRWGRWCMAVLMCWFWSVLALAVWVATPWSPHAAMYGGAAIACLLSLLRLFRPGG